MRVLLLADHGGLAVEGARNVSQAILEGMKHRVQVLSMPAAAAVKHLVKLSKFNPQIVHTIHGPSSRTFALLAVLRLFLPRAAFLASLNHTNSGGHFPPSLVRRLRYINLLSQDPVSERAFSQLGFSVQPLPNGVDTQRFRPSKPFLPESLLSKLDAERPVLLHIGHLKPNRGLDIFPHLCRYRGWQVVIAGSPSMPANSDVVDMLQSAGCIVMHEFIDNLPGLYCSMNAYVFPVSDATGAIDMPLSVLEAMACNLPIVTTRFKALPRFLPKGDGLYFYDSIDQAKACLDQIMQGNHIATRDKVLPYSWINICDQLEKVYTSCLI